MVTKVEQNLKTQCCCKLACRRSWSVILISKRSSRFRVIIYSKIKSPLTLEFRLDAGMGGNPCARVNENSSRQNQESLQNCHCPIFIPNTHVRESFSSWNSNRIKSPAFSNIPPITGHRSSNRRLVSIYNAPLTFLHQPKSIA